MPAMCLYASPSQKCLKRNPQKCYRDDLSEMGFGLVLLFLLYTLSVLGVTAMNLYYFYN